MKSICILVAAAILVACSGARSVLVDAVPTAPAREACVVGMWKCEGNAPYRCARDETNSTVTRWWSAHGLTSDGASVAPCRVRCVVDGAPHAAHCAGAEDAGVTSDADAS